MRAFLQKRIPVLAIFSALLLASTSPRFLLADDDKDKTTPHAKAAPAKPDAAAPALTERERMLLDRVEQLEKRVAELDAKGGPQLFPQPLPQLRPRCRGSFPLTPAMRQ